MDTVFLPTAPQLVVRVLVAGPRDRDPRRGRLGVPPAGGCGADRRPGAGAGGPSRTPGVMSEGTDRRTGRSNGGASRPRGVGGTQDSIGKEAWTSGTTAEEKLARLRELILNARSMPMSASCVINRGDVLAAIDDVIDNLPDEIAEAQSVIDASQAKIAEGEAEAGRILAEAREQAPTLAKHSEVVRVAEERPPRSGGSGGRGRGAAPRGRHVHRLPDGQLRVGAAQDDQPGVHRARSDWPQRIAAPTRSRDARPRHRR